MKFEINKKILKDNLCLHGQILDNCEKKKNILGFHCINDTIFIANKGENGSLFSNIQNIDFKGSTEFFVNYLKLFEIIRRCLDKKINIEIKKGILTVFSQQEKFEIKLAKKEKEFIVFPCAFSCSKDRIDLEYSEFKHILKKLNSDDAENILIKTDNNRINFVSTIDAFTGYSIISYELENRDHVNINGILNPLAIKILSKIETKKNDNVIFYFLNGNSFFAMGNCCFKIEEKKNAILNK